MESKEPVPSSCCCCDGVKAPGVLLGGLTLQRLGLGGSHSEQSRSLPLKRWPLSGLGAQETGRSEVRRAGFHVGQEPRTQRGTVTWPVMGLEDKKKMDV